MQQSVRESERASAAPQRKQAVAKWDTRSSGIQGCTGACNGVRETTEQVEGRFAQETDATETSRQVQGQTVREKSPGSMP